MTATTDATHPRPGFRTRSSVTVSSRHPGDAVRIAVGLVVLGACLLAVQRDGLSVFEADIFRTVNNLPDGFSYVLGPVMQLGNLIAVFGVAAVAFVAIRRHRRAALDIAVAGTAAWFAAKLLKSLVERPRPAGLMQNVQRLGTTDGLGFVSGHTAVAAAIVTAASPYLPRTARRASWAIVAAVGLARMYYGAHLPLDIIGGAAIGWVTGATLHLLLGAPHRRPTLAEAEAALRRTGVDVTSVREVHGPFRGSFPFVADIGGSCRFVKLLDPEPRDRDWLYRTARYFAVREVRDETTADDPVARANREAAMTMFARCHGARVPTIEAIVVHDGRVWLIEDHLDATMLDQLDTADLSDDLLDSLWSQIALLRAAGVAHRDLVASNVLVDAEGEPWLVDFAHGISSTESPGAFDDDVAELLVTTALLVGPERATAAAARTLGSPAIGAAVPQLQPLVLTAESRDRLRGHPGLLDELRAVAARAAGSPLEPYERSKVDGLRRAGVLGSAVLSVMGVIALAGPDAVLEVIASAGLRWLGLAAACVALLPFAAAASLLVGIDRRIALGRTAGDVLVLRRRTLLDGRTAGAMALVARLRRAGVSAAETRVALRRWTRLSATTSAVGAVLLAALASSTQELFSPAELTGGLTALLIAAVVVELLISRGRRSSETAPAEPASAGPVRPADRGTLLLAGLVETGVFATAAVALVMAMGGGSGAAWIAAVALAVRLITQVGPVAGAPATGPILMTIGLSSGGVMLPVAAAATVALQLLEFLVPITAGWLVSRSRKQA